MRIELFFKSSVELSSTLNFITENNLFRFRPVEISHLPLKYDSFDYGINVPNKRTKETSTLLSSASQIFHALPDAHISLHYSLKNNKYRGLELCTENFIRFLEDSAAIGVQEVLLVSGSSGNMKPFINAVTCLQQLRKLEYKLPAVAHKTLRVGVAFNPYLFSPIEVNSERERLLQKLSSGYPTAVYLQFGSDIDLLKDAIAFLNNEIRPRFSSVHIIGSIFLPSRQLLARMKLRPWKGLYLSPEFLGDVERATVIVRQMLELYALEGIEPILETAVRNEKDIAALDSLIVTAGERKV